MPTTTEPPAQPLPAYARPLPRQPFFDVAPGRVAHDFLVLNQRPDLTAELVPPALAGTATIAPLR